jgi:hypothetical protein
VLSMPTETWNLFASIGKKSKTIDIIFEAIHSISVKITEFR